MRQEKRCPRHNGGAGRVLPIAEFHKDRNALDGHQSYCKACTNAMRRDRYQRCGRGLRDLYAAVRRRAQRDEIPFEISWQEFLRLTAQPCAYGGGERPAVNISIGRKNPAAGYVLENIVTSCARHNTIKGDLFAFESMLRIAKEFEEAKDCG